tara:strand:+ start:802 stop:1446 length:645 start_codon:yes stop_codon:yes gene_type:complete
MELELACYDRLVNYDEILNNIFTGAKCTAKCLCIPSGLISKTSFFKEYIKISAAIDFPYGLSATSVRLHEILVAVRSGASFIDLVVNTNLTAESDWAEIRKDMRACSEVCDAHDVQLRPIIEYRLFPVDTVIKLCEVLKSAGASYIANSTGTMADDTSDNVIISHSIQEEVGVHVIACGRIWTPEHFQLFHNAGIHTIRLTSPRLAEEFLENGV